jgi:polysaccharide export outer membrane protein
MKRFAALVKATTMGCACLAIMLSTSGIAHSDAPYVIHSGDSLNVVVYGEQSLTGPVIVLPDGTISLALVGHIQVAGQSPDQAAETIKSALEKYIRHPDVTVAVTQIGQVNVMVLGDVKSPGKYALPPTGTVSDAVAAAGGLNPLTGPYPDARIAGPSGDITQVSLEKLLHDGDVSQNKSLKDGSIVYIPSPVTISVQVVGTVDKPGEIDLRQGDRLSMAIAQAGTSGAGAQADLNNITVTRTGPDGKSYPIKVNLYETLKGGDISKDLVMEKGDLVYVPMNKPKLGATNNGGVLGQSAFFLLSSLKLLGL